MFLYFLFHSLIPPVRCGRADTPPSFPFRRGEGEKTTLSFAFLEIPEENIFLSVFSFLRRFLRPICIIFFSEPYSSFHFPNEWCIFILEPLWELPTLSTGLLPLMQQLLWFLRADKGRCGQQSPTGHIG